ncbi:unnamed protein product [Strongylus vulgaris]|uniref:Uncharacterized protein n=1 Tax=Strongylus vulgaris TaxID=40348 RepID=A0A3P7KKQ4_STRVU|nr:unnamed protein product [Strongylus vulgaris]
MWGDRRSGYGGRSPRSYIDFDEKFDAPRRGLDAQSRSGACIGRTMNCINMLFIVLLICGSVVAAIITFITKPEANDDKGYQGKVVYFAMFRGDADDGPSPSENSKSASKCSLNVPSSSTRVNKEMIQGRSDDLKNLLYH